MNIERFAELAYLRHEIYIKKALGEPKPWTGNGVFQRSFFCNVFRRIDKTTDWMMRNIAEPLKDDPYLWASLVLARYVSRIDVLEDLKAAGAFAVESDWDTRRRVGAQRMLERKVDGKPINTAAFITSPMLGAWGPTKAHYIARLILAMSFAGLTDALRAEKVSMQKTWEGLRQFRAVGSFMAYQYCCDFSYVPAYLGRAIDIYSWSAPGPGSMRGMKRILFGSPDAALSKEDWLLAVQKAIVEWREYIAVTLPNRTARLCEMYPKHSVFVSDEMGRFCDIRMQDVQHWLCEYDKYERGGSAKRKYDGRR